MNKKWLKNFVSAAVSALILYVLVSGWQICAYGEKDERREADVAIVLGAGVTGDKPSPVFQERINHGIWLYENGYVKTLIMTGGYGEGATCSEARAALGYAVGRGIPREAILIDEKSRITQENLYYAKQLMEEYGMKDALIVSDPLHMKRAMEMAEDYGIEAYTSPTPTTRFVSMRTKLPFLARELFFYTGYRLYRFFVAGSLLDGVFMEGRDEWAEYPG